MDADCGVADEKHGSFKILLTGSYRFHLGKRENATPHWENFPTCNSAHVCFLVKTTNSPWLSRETGVFTLPRNVNLSRPDSYWAGAGEREGVVGSEPG